MNGRMNGARREQGSWTWGGCVLDTTIHTDAEDGEPGEERVDGSSPNLRVSTVVS